MKPRIVRDFLIGLPARYPLRTAASAVFFIATAAWMWKAATWQDTFSIEDRFQPGDRIQSYMERGEGEPLPSGELGVAGGEKARRRYIVNRRADQRLFLRIKKSPSPMINFAAVLVYLNAEVPLDPALLDGRPIDITQDTAPGKMRIELRMENRDSPGGPPIPALESFSIERWAPKAPIRWGGFLFFAAGATYFWFVVLIIVVPSIWARCSLDRAGLTDRRRILWMLGAAVVLGGCIWLWAHPVWKAKKDYDDRTAISNGALLLDFGYQSGQMYFRSRVRPAFPAIIQPLLVAAPHRFDSYWLNPSDNFTRDWFIYDQDNWSFGLFEYPFLCFAAMSLALVMAGLLYSIYRKVDASLLAAGLASVLCLIFFRRSLAIPITQTVNLLVNVLAVWAFLHWGQRGSIFQKFFAGTILGFAFIEKETATTTALSLALFLFMDGPPKEAARRFAASTPYWLGVTLWPVYYFGFVSAGGFPEILSNFSDHLRQQEINHFESLTPAGGLRDMWAVFSFGLPIALLGFALSAIRGFRERSDRLFLAWTIGCLPVFTLPYIFPRFLQFYIPSMAFWATTVAVEAGNVISRSRGR